MREVICKPYKIMLKISFLILSVCTATIVAKQFRCDYTYNEDLNSWLKFNEIPASWHDARLQCRLEGTTLASPTSEVKPVLLSIMNKLDGKSKRIFTGIHSTVVKGSYTTIEGVPLSKINHSWAEGEPNNEKNQENCLTLDHSGDLADVRCDNVYPYFCIKNNKDELINRCGTVDNEYTLDTKTGSCYKFHRIGKAWPIAYKTCLAEGGYLAIINSDEESQVMKSILEKNPPESLFNYLWKDGASIGFYDWNVRGDWVTVHGEPISEAGFDKFTPGQPDNATTGEFCGMVWRTGLLNDVWCETAAPFICEKSPYSLLCGANY